MIKPNRIDRLIASVFPSIGVSRLKSRMQFSALSGGYSGGKRTRTALSGWKTTRGDADSDILPDLPMLRERSADLIRNNPIAKGANNTKVTHVIGSGLKLNSAIDQEYLGLSDGEVEEFQATAEREFRLWANSQNCDVQRELTFPEHQELAYRSVLDGGDHFVLQTSVERADSPYSLALQHIEADRVCNKDHVTDTDNMVAGVHKDAQGAPVEYDVLTGHPGSYTQRHSMEWTTIPAFGRETGRRVTLHLYHKLRPGQTRGVPDLAPVIEVLKQLGRYLETEVDASVKAASWALLLKTETGDGLGMAGLEYDEWQTSRRDYYKENPVDLEGGSAGVIGLFPDDEFQGFDPQRPNTAFDPFVQSMLMLIGMALELPKEVLMKHFQSSYSAARGALMEAWVFFQGRRAWMARNFCQPIYETWLAEAVSLGRVSAPGFFADPAIRAAWCGAEWIGDAPGYIDEEKAVKAAKGRIELGVSNRKRETPALTGEDYDKVRRQSEKEPPVQESAANASPSAEELDQADKLESVRNG